MNKFKLGRKVTIFGSRQGTASEWEVEQDTSILGLPSPMATLMHGTSMAIMAMSTTTTVLIEIRFVV
jgi:hypothetical protein